jgi:Ca2+-binding RTX toxin-like protein
MGKIAWGLEAVKTAVEQLPIPTDIKAEVVKHLDYTSKFADSGETAYENLYNEDGTPNDNYYHDVANDIIGSVVAEAAYAAAIAPFLPAIAAATVTAPAWVVPALVFVVGAGVGYYGGEIISDAADINEREVSKLLDRFGINFFRRDPLVFDLNFDGARLTALPSTESVLANPSITTTYFDLDSDGYAERTGWISPQDGFLALDANLNGVIDNGSELFGSAQDSGFTILRLSDANSDGIISSLDPIYSSLLIWQDINQDGLSQSGEITSLSNRNIDSINLAASPVSLDQRGNTIEYRSNYTLGTGDSAETIAVSFANDRVNTHFHAPDNFSYDAEVFDLPNLRGYGQVPDLWVAMTLDQTLKQMVKDIVDSEFTSLSQVVGNLFETVDGGSGTGGQGGNQTIQYHYEASSFDDMLSRWAGVSILSGEQDESQAESTVERFVNKDILVGLGAGNPAFHDAYQKFSADQAFRFFVQIPTLGVTSTLLDLIQRMADTPPDNGTMFSTEEIEDLLTPTSVAFGEIAAAHPDTAIFESLGYDFKRDKVVGDIRGFIDSLLEDLPFDDMNPWSGYLEWYADHRLELSVIDPDQSFLREEHRKFTGNLGLSILIAPHSELTGDLGANSITGDQSGTAYPDLIQGLGGNDTLQGGGGSDTYVMSDGAGSDTIIDTLGTSDELAFQGNLTSALARYSFTDSAHRDLLIEFDGRSESVLVEDYFTSTGEATIEQITFPDGPEVSHRDVRDAVYADLGTSGNDTVTGFVLGTTVDGKGGDDLLSGQGDSDKLIGGTGSDTLIGNGGDDVLTGGTGNDNMRGGHGSDSYNFAAGDGQDTLSEYGSDSSGNDTLFLGEGIAPQDVTITQADNGHDFVLTFAGSTDQITLDNTNTTDAYRIDQLQFADGTIWSFTDMFERSITPTSGNDILYGSSDSDVMLGDAGNDLLEGRAGNDRLAGGAGNDSLYGNAGDDTFVFGIGDGQDVATEYDGNGGGFDTLQFGAGIAPGDLTFQQANNGRDFILGINGTTDQITLDNTNTGLSYNGAAYKIDQVRFADGTLWSFSELLAHVTAPTSGNDAFYGDETANTLAGGAGNDQLHGNAGNDTLTGGTGDDSLHGEYGNDTYLFELGDGQDIVTEYGYDGTDTVEFGVGIAPTDITVSQADNGQDIVLKINGTTDQITLDNTNMGYTEYRVDQVRFDGGTVWSWAEILEHSSGATAGDDVLYGDSGANTLAGGAGNDTLHGNSGDDRLIGGTGDDSLHGEYGNDTYLFELGDGQDIVTEYGYDGTDTVEFGVGIAPTDITVSQADNGQDIVLKINGTTDQITLDNTNMGYTEYRVDQVRFDDATVWSWADILAQATQATSGNDALYGDISANTLAGGAGDDTIYGRSGNDTLTGGTGNDTLYGNSGNDIYNFALGDGQDIVSEYTGGDYGGTDAVVFAAGITPGDVTVARADNGNDYVLLINGTADRVTLDNTNTGDPDYRIEEVRFADGTVWNSATIEAHVDPALILGNGGNQTLWGDSADNIFSSGAGDDDMIGGAGDDTYLFNLGDGHDSVSDWNGGGYGNPGFDVLKFGPGIVPEDVYVERDGNSPVLKIENTSDQVLIYNNFNWDNRAFVEQVQFDDGTIWAASMLRAALSGTSADNSLNGSAAGEIIRARAGNDLVDAASGNDDVAGGAGNDKLIGGGGDDLLRGGDGDDTIDGDEIVLLPTGANLLVNGGFETIGTIVETGPWGRASYDMSGWTRANSGRFNQIYSGWDGIAASEGSYRQDMDDAGGSGSNLDISQTVSGLTAGQQMLLEFDHANSVSAASGAFEVYWNGALVASINETGTAVRTKQLSLVAVAGNNVLRFRAIGPEDGVGSSLDNIRLFEATEVRRGIGDDVILGGAGSDVLNGGAGDDHIEGGDGNDTLIGGDDLPVGDIDRLTPTSANLLANGSFEDIGTIVETGAWGRASHSLPGWTRANSARYNQVYSGWESVGASDGNYWLDLDDAGGAGSNLDISQTVGGLTAGQTMMLAFDHINYVGTSSGAFEVYWNGSLVTTVSESGTAMQTTKLELTGVAGDNVLRFRGIGAEEGRGGAIDNVRLFTAADVGGLAGDDALLGGLGDDVLIGGSGDDELDGGGGSDTATFAGVRSSYTISTSGGSIQITDDAPSVDGDNGTDTLIGTEHAQFQDQTISLSTPIVLDLDGNGIRLTNAVRSRVRFDFDGDGKRDRTGWVSSGDGILVFDRNGDGKVTDASEISFVDDKPGALSDLDGLRAFDSNGDGLFSSSDERFGEFSVWRDRDQDGAVDKREMISLTQAGVAAIDLAGQATERDWAWGSNIIVNEGGFIRTNGSRGKFADVALSYEASSLSAGAQQSRMFARQLIEAGAAFGAQSAGSDFTGQHVPEDFNHVLFSHGYSRREL